MSQVICTNYFTCDNADLPTELVLRQMMVANANGCPAFRVMPDNPALQTYRNVALSNTGQLASNVSAELRSWNIINPNSHDVYVKLYDTSSASNASASHTPAFVLYIPQKSAFMQDNTGVLQHFFENGICVRACQGIADNDNTPPANNIYVEIRFI
jgi:hypothetical protein